MDETRPTELNPSSRPPRRTARQERFTAPRPHGGEHLPVFLTPDEAADLLRTTRKAIYVKIERRQLPGVSRIGRRVLIRSASLLEWLDQQGAASLQEAWR